MKLILLISLTLQRLFFQACISVSFSSKYFQHTLKLKIFHTEPTIHSLHIKHKTVIHVVKTSKLYIKQQQIKQQQQ